MQKDNDKAFRYFKSAADSGDARAQYMLHYFYFKDDNYKNYEIGEEYLKKSAEQGDVLAQKLLAQCHMGFFNLVEDDEKFVFWMRKAADQGDAEAQRILGEAFYKLENERALPKSYADAVEWLNKAANQEDIQALILLAELYYEGEGVDMDFEKSAAYLQRAEQNLKEKESEGSSMASEHQKIANLYYKDKSNRQKSFDHYCKALSAGLKDVLYNVGWMHFINEYNSQLMNTNPDELLHCIKEEAKTSISSNLAYLLGEIYYRGCRVQENKNEAEKWYLIAKDKGSLLACCQLAIYYINVKRQRVKGYSLLEETYKKGSVEAARLLGYCYKNGIGVKKSRARAKALLKEAAAKGDKEAAEELKKFRF